MPNLAQPLTEEQRQYVPGYEYMPEKDRYGPWPGVERFVKEQYDQMSDRRFMEAFLGHTGPEQMSLMIAEDDRKRTYVCQWKNLEHLPYKYLAREGFYYTGQSDRVKCAFCGDVLDSWVFDGATPSARHKRRSASCEMVTKLPPYRNLPSESEPDIAEYDSYNVVKNLGVSEATLRCVFERNLNKDFSDVQALWDAVLAHEKRDVTKQEKVQRRERCDHPGATTTNQGIKLGREEGHANAPPAKCLKSEE